MSFFHGNLPKSKNGAKVFGIERAHRGLTTTELQSVPLAVCCWYTARSRGLLDGEDEAGDVPTSHREQTRAFQPGPTTSRFSQAGGRARYLWIPAVAPPRVPWQRQRGAGWLLCFSLLTEDRCVGFYSDRGNQAPSRVGQHPFRLFGIRHSPTSRMTMCDVRENPREGIGIGIREMGK